MFLSTLASQLSEKMAIGGKLTLMGVLIVFVLLGLIVVILTIMERIMRKSGEKPAKQRKNIKELLQSKKKTEKEKPEVTVSSTVYEETANNGISPEIVAAITAAIAASMSVEGENSDRKFIVRNIKKLSYRR